MAYESMICEMITIRGDSYRLRQKRRSGLIKSPSKNP